MEERNFGYLGFTFQQSLIKAIIEDKKYGETIIDVIEAKFFDNNSFRFIMENTKELYKNYNKIPDYNTLAQKIMAEGGNKDSSKIHVDTLEAIKNNDSQIEYVKDTALNFCKQQKFLETNNSRAKKAAREFAQAIKGLETPLSNFGGYTNEKSSAVQAGQALERNLKTATDICTMIQYYSYPSYGGTQEEFCEAVGGELKGKFDASTNFSELFGLPFYRIVNKVGYKPISEY